jgi:multidrug resistance protein
MNFPRWKKWLITCLLGLATFVVTFASSVFSTATQATAQQFGVSNEVMILGTSLFVFGFAVGPPIWGPLSELYGRKYPLFISFFIFGIFQIPVAVAQNLQTIMLCRFFGGVFGSAPLGIVGGTLVDFWEPVDRGVAMTIFAGATFIGPVAGPVAGGFIVQSYLGWRWTEYLTAIMAFGFGFIAFVFVPETYAPVLLSQRAKKIRFETKNWAIHAKLDEQQIDLKNIAERYLLRAFKMLLKEPILDLITLYMALIYGIMYLFFEAYPIAFQEERGWNSGVGALPFLGITIGVLIGGAIIIYTSKTRFARKLREEGQVVPEERLIPMIIGGALFPIGMFWFAWTSSPNITWVPQVLAGIPIGAGVLMIFLQGLNYIIDVYLMHANSAIAANTFVRSLFGSGFPLFATAM